MLFLPQRPYLPVGRLKQAACYPAPEESVTDDAARTAGKLQALGFEPVLSPVLEIAALNSELPPPGPPRPPRPPRPPPFWLLF